MTRGLLVVVAAVMLTGCNLWSMNQPQVPTQENNSIGGSDEVVEEVGGVGVIRGPLIYPSEVVPPEMVVCAQNVETREEVCNDVHVEYQGASGEGFELEVPGGGYYVYAFLPSNQMQKAYYNEFVTCGLKAECESREKIEVKVDAGKTVDDIKPHDWYAPIEEEKVGL